MFRILSLVTALGIASPALAHHPLGGLPMTRFSEGVLSGIGHPILGFDHLFFVLLAGVVSAQANLGLRGPLTYLVAMTTGCAAVSTGVSIPWQAPMILTSLVLMGALAAYGAPARHRIARGGLALFGLFHGAGFAETIAGQEISAGSMVLAGYLLGLILVQFLMAGGAYVLTRRLAPVQARLAGAMAMGAGILLTLEHLEGPLLQRLVG
jgi:urease accessory protein